eukprot:115594_1
MSLIAFTLLFIVQCLSRQIWKDARQPIEQRVNALLEQMTLEEKINQLISWQYYPPPTFQYGVGHIKQSGGNPAAWISFRNQQQEIVINASRLNIPAGFHAESLHSSAPGGTVFPTPITQGCSWNTTLIEEITSIIALESRTVGTDVMYSPVLNMWTDPRFGRASEGYSENPTLSAHYARAAVEGFQNDNAGGPYTYLADNKGISLAKHYAAYGAGIGALNAAPSDISMRTMFEIYLKPWRAFGKAGGRGAMTSHQTLNRVPMHANSYFVNEIFRNRFGFGDGMIVSDCNDIGVLQQYRIAANKSQAAARGLIGGVDLDLTCGNPSSNAEAGSYLQLKDAINNGWFNESIIDLSVKRVLAGKYAVGLFDNNTYVNDINAWKNILNSAKHIELAYEAALQSITILQVHNNLYSLKQKYESGKLKNIAFIGPNAQCNTNQTGKQCDTAVNYLGPYTSQDDSIQVLTLFQAFQQSDKYKDIKITYNKGVDIQSKNTNGIQAAVNAAKQADAVIMVIGDSIATCGEWKDNDNLDPPGQQLNLTRQVVNALSGTNIPVILVLINGRQFTFAGGDPSNPVLKGVDLLMTAFRPGQMGGVALRDVIMGDAENSGRLAQNWPKITGDVNSGSSPWLQEIRGKWVANSRSSPDLDGRVYDSYQNEKNYYNEITDPLFAFGFGISNTGCSSMFKYSNLKVKTVNTSSVQTDDSIVMEVTVNVINNCKTPATDVFEVYLVDPEMTNMDANVPILVRYWKRLIGFKKFKLNAAQSTTLSVDIRFDDVAIYVDEEFKSFELVHGEYTVRGGQSSRTDALSQKITL